MESFDERYLISLNEDRGSEKNKLRWEQEAAEKNLIFICRDSQNANNAWYRYECGHIGMINKADVRRGKYCCRKCKFVSKYQRECKAKGLLYITHYCENEQSLIIAECLACNTENTFRVSSITHHKTVDCPTCKLKSWQEKAFACGFEFLERIDGYWANYKCLFCGLKQPKRFSDVGKNEARCECVIEDKNKKLLEIIKSDAEKRGFELVKKIDGKWCLYKCQLCGEEDTYQFQAMRIGNARCRTATCNPNKSRAQRLIEHFLINDLGYNNILKNEITFDDLIGLGGNKLRYDIGYYKNRKLEWLIEYDGKQHESPQRFRSHMSQEEANAQFRIQKEHDRLKDEYAKKLGIPLLRISHSEYVKNIWKEKILQFLMDCSFMEHQNSY